MKVYVKFLLPLLFVLILTPMTIQDNIPVPNKALIFLIIHITFISTFVIGSIQRAALHKRRPECGDMSDGQVLRQIWVRIMFAITLATAASGLAYSVLLNPIDLERLGPYTNLILYLTPVILFFLYSVIGYLFGSEFIRHILRDL